MIGLSTGSWAQVIANHPQVERLTVVEIARGYVELIREQPAVRSLLTNPRVEIVYDDGRRWLRNHPESEFEMIVMNTTFHWRSNVGALLSQEFMQMAQERLAEGGVFFFNTTDSERAYKTALSVFEHGVRVMNFVAVSDRRIEPDVDHWRRILVAYEIDGRAVLPASSKSAGRVMRSLLRRARSLGQTHDASEAKMESGRGLWARVKDVEVITDDNMGDEWSFHKGHSHLY